MRTSRLCAACAVVFSVVLALVAGAAWAVYAVRISDLQHSPTPPNPIRVCGRVTSESPLKLSDGRGETIVTGRTATLGEFLVLDGWWNGQFFSVVPIETIYIPAGTFLMGNNGAEPYSCTECPGECPQHSVTLSAYYMGKYEVTRSEYRVFMNAGGYSDSAYWSTAGWNWRVSSSRTQPSYWDVVQDWGTGSFTQTDSHPVVGVSYYEAEAFCNWAGGHLPTEAQWERAARWTGSYPNVYPWGNTWNQEYCNNYFDSNSAGGGYVKYQTAPVGSYSSYRSPSGCHNMAGNVWEWCRDWYLSSYYSESPLSDPQGPASGAFRVLRGGSWYDTDCYSRCAFRAYTLISIGQSNNRYGFRLAR